MRLALKRKCLAQSNKSLDDGNATKKCSALRDTEREGPNSNFDPLCQLAPVVNGWGFFRCCFPISRTNRLIMAVVPLPGLGEQMLGGE